ncbi:uncharacterized protein PRCAT00001023001 [Priceomyces carsonii]|uniref:uncharacterized protein n=1 Tax=Priceomyces carsonii TaxID=28549 RepID=UPI002EDA4DBF|nr:unnamed protein product [Priceomyces carsonii]
MDKRQIERSVSSPVCNKKPRIRHESTGKENNPLPLDRPKNDRKVEVVSKKTKYFFNPIDTLMENPHRISSEKKEQVKETETKNVSYNPDESYDRMLQELQSSDDSFEGVKWRASPKKLMVRKVLPSSPLREVHNQSNKDSSGITVLNEQANSVLTKYGSDFQNIMSQTPRIIRARSDISSAESIHKKRNLTTTEPQSPSLVRAMSSGCKRFSSEKNLRNEEGGPKKLLDGTLAGTLNNWIDKFDMSGSVHASLSYSDHKQSDLKPNTTKDANQIDIQQIDFSDEFSDSSQPKGEETTNFGESCVAGDSSSEDPFSDDDDQILQVLNMQDEPRAVSENIVINQEDGKRNSEAKENALNVLGHESIDADDPFSDDDLDFLEVKARTTLDSEKTGPLALQNNKTSRHVSDYRSESKISFLRRELRRYEIIDIKSSSYNVKGRKREQLLLSVVNSTKADSKLIVRGEYSELDFNIGDIIHLIITDSSNERLVDDTKNLLIWNPDILVSATTVSQQLGCPRKTVLLNRFSFPSASSLPLLVGVIIHSIFQSCFISENWCLEFMKKILKVEIEQHLIEILSLNQGIETVQCEIEKQLPYLKTWFDTYYKKPLSSNVSIPTNHYKKNILFSATEALDVEENIWSPMFGIKGMVDVTLEAKIASENSRGKFLLPMEIKTGKEHISHQAQSSLYSLLFKDRYDMDVNSFLLVYTKERITKQYDISPADLRSLVNLRNRITKYLKENTRELPPLIKQSQCDRCEIQEPCMVINNLIEDGCSKDCGIKEDVFESINAHLNEKAHYKNFYNHWDDLITKEESIMMKLKRDLWKFSAIERESDNGKAIGDLVLKESDDLSDSQEEFIYTFEKLTPLSNLQDSQLSKSDKVIVSDESGHFAIAQGFVVTISPSILKISTNRRIISSDMKLKDFNMLNNQSFQGVLHKSQFVGGPKKTFRVDKDDMFHGLSLARFNLLNLFLPNGDHRRREAVVDLKAPKFSKSPMKYTVAGHFNSDQLQAFEKVLRTEDYSLILGMPGTGKTSVIAELIRLIVQNGKTVFLASYTHSAVDNILLKVKDYGIDILRIGSPSKVHKDLRRFLPNFDASKKVENYNDLMKTYVEPPVVASTCLGINDITFNLRQKFDFCIIDEASQVSMPVNLGPLRFCDKFVLVGDHFQLPPLVQHHSQAVKTGLSQSLFKILAENHPQSVVELTYQYRMCKEIMHLSNVLIYNGRLKCGSEEVSNKCLYIPHPECIKKYSVGEINMKNHWMQWILKMENKVLFLNHDQVPGNERKVGEKIENMVEVELTKQIVEGLICCGVKQNDIGVMSLYRSQLKLLRRALNATQDIEILTADQFQGRDKECIVISLVRSNAEGQIGDLIKEWRRVNVAITRSKSKLIILGSKSTLSSAESTRSFVEVLSEKGWVYDLPFNASQFYDFPSSTFSSQNSTKRNSVKINGSQIVNSKLIKEHPIIRDIINDIKN